MWQSDWLKQCWTKPTRKKVKDSSGQGDGGPLHETNSVRCSSTGYGRARVIRDENASSYGGGCSSTAGTTLKQVATIDLPGPAGKRFDYLTIDYDDGYLLSAHLGAGLLYVIDLK